MRRIRLFALGVASFTVALIAAFLSPGTWLNRAIASAMCTVFSFNSAICTVDLGRYSDRVVAATPPAMEKTIFDGFEDLLVQRDPNEFGDDQPTTTPPVSNPQVPAFPQDPGPNQPLRRPDFDDERPSETLNPELKSPTGTINFLTDNGCQQAFELQSDSGKIYLDSAKLNVSLDENCSHSSEIFVKYTNNKDKFIISGDGLKPITVQVLNNENFFNISYIDKSSIVYSLNQKKIK